MLVKRSGLQKIEMVESLSSRTYWGGMPVGKWTMIFSVLPGGGVVPVGVETLRPPLRAVLGPCPPLRPRSERLERYDWDGILFGGAVLESNRWCAPVSVVGYVSRCLAKSLDRSALSNSKR